MCRRRYSGYGKDRAMNPEDYPVIMTSQEDGPAQEWHRECYLELPKPRPRMTGGMRGKQIFSDDIHRCAACGGYLTTIREQSTEHDSLSGNG